MRSATEIAQLPRLFCAGLCVGDFPRIHVERRRLESRRGSPGCSVDLLLPHSGRQEMWRSFQRASESSPMSTLAPWMPFVRVRGKCMEFPDLRGNGRKRNVGTSGTRCRIIYIRSAWIRYLGGKMGVCQRCGRIVVRSTSSCKNHSPSHQSVPTYQARHGCFRDSMSIDLRTGHSSRELKCTELKQLGSKESRPVTHTFFHAHSRVHLVCMLREA